MNAIKFPVGYQTFHKAKMFDFQLNRWYSMGYLPLDELHAAASKIETIEDWQNTLEGNAESEKDKGNFLKAAFYYRAADFYTGLDHPKKDFYYQEFQDLFKKGLPDEIQMIWDEIPFKNGFLPTIKFLTDPANKKGDIVLHGGYDSYKEEFLSIALYFVSVDYDVYVFDGPGQGGAIKNYGITMNYEWEKPVSSVLDFYQLSNVTLIGLSMGGWLCFRAAANDERIKRVIASSVAYDYSKIAPGPLAAFAKWMLKHEKVTNWISYQQMKQIPSEKWRIENLMYITGTKTPVESGYALFEFNAEHIQSENVSQDVLILTGEKDHASPMRLHHMQVNALTKAKSITERIFTAEDHAENHCQVGNLGLALKTMKDWINDKS